jgi:DNA-binding transcriptional MerR regulator
VSGGGGSTDREAVPGFSIGEVMARLRPEFDDVSISKIRFLESEGLVEPSRTTSGYRKFTDADVARLRYVLAAQRDHYLPLKVIKEHLAAMDRGLRPPVVASASPAPPVGVTEPPGLPRAEDFTRPHTDLKLTSTELVTAAGISTETLGQLESYGLLIQQDGHYDGEALLIAKTAAELGAYGVEARHLRPFRTAADREIGLIEQVVSPVARQRGTEAAQRADDTVRELAALSVRLHAALVRSGLRRQRGTSS